MNNYDVITVGGGIGGLFASAKLAQQGKKVLLIEKHSVVGGFCTSFKRKGYFFEAAIHALNGLEDTKSVFYKNFTDLDILRRLPLIKLPEFYAVKIGNDTIEIPADWREAQEYLLKRYPSEKTGIATFFTELIGLNRELTGFPRGKWKILSMLPILPFKFPRVLKYFKQNLASFIDSLTQNEELKIVLTANACYYHDNPADYSMLHFAAGQGSYFTGGASFITGGSGAIAEILAEDIRKAGGEVLVSCEVTKLITEGGRVVGAEWNSRGSVQSERASEVIANLPFPVLLKLLPANLSRKLGKPYTIHKPSISISSVYFALKKPLREIGSTGYSTFFLPPEMKTFADTHRINNAKNPASRLLSLVDYSCITGIFGENESGPTAAAVIVDRADRWRGLSKDQYRIKKLEMVEGIMVELEKQIPGFRENCFFVEGSTPLTMERYTGNPDGVVYGFAPSVGQLGPGRPQVVTPIKGLTIASAWGPMGGGITAASGAGMLAAAAVLKRL